MRRTSGRSRRARVVAVITGLCATWVAWSPAAVIREIPPTSFSTLAADVSPPIEPPAPALAELAVARDGLAPARLPRATSLIATAASSSRLTSPALPPDADQPKTHLTGQGIDAVRGAGATDERPVGPEAQVVPLAPVPEPTAGLFFAGAALAAFLRRRERRSPRPN